MVITALVAAALLLVFGLSFLFLTGGLRDASRGPADEPAVAAFVSSDTCAGCHAGLHHALGLTLVRLKRTDEALGELLRAAELDPRQARYAYVYAVGLHSAARAGDAIAVLKDSLVRHPDDRDTLQALMTFSRDSGNLGSALDYAERLARIPPTDPNLAGLIQDLRRQAGRPTAQ
jgi:Flp pilus assembly protein TadD